MIDITTLVADFSNSGNKLNLSPRLEIVQNNIDESRQAEYSKILCN